MKLSSILTAALVMAMLYLVVVERDRLFSLARGGDAAGPAVAEAATPAPAEADAVPPAVSVVALRSVAQEFDSGIILRGRTEASRQVEVRAQTNGLVMSEPLRRGAMVAAGDLLCELDPGTRQAELDEATARLAEAEARLPEAEARVPAAEAQLLEARSRVGETEARVLEAQARLTEAEINKTAAIRLEEGGFATETRVANADAALQSARAGVISAEAALQGTRAQIASAEAGVEGARAAVEGARASIRSALAAIASIESGIDQLRITAPFAGLLETDAAELGSLLQPGSPCATVIQLDPIKLVGFAPEADVGNITLGAMAGARLPSGAEVQGLVAFVSRSADEQTRTFRVDVEVANADLSIRDGETAEILIATRGVAAHLLPQSALTLDDEGRLGVRSVTAAGQAQFLPVTFLRDTVDGVWVAGLPAQVDVIVIGQEFVVDGVVVAATYRGANG